MLKRIHAVIQYCPDVRAGIACYEQLGLTLHQLVEEKMLDGTSCLRARLRYPDGEAELVLHDDSVRQFTELSVLVDDVCRAYKELLRCPGFLWLELPHNTSRGCVALVRAPDGNVFSLIGPQSACRCLEGNTCCSLTRERSRPRPL